MIQSSHLSSLFSSLKPSSSLSMAALQGWFISYKSSVSVSFSYTLKTYFSFLSENQIKYRHFFVRFYLATWISFACSYHTISQLGSIFLISGSKNRFCLAQGFLSVNAKPSPSRNFEFTSNPEIHLGKIFNWTYHAFVFWIN